jgi:hypothetical protein
MLAIVLVVGVMPTYWRVSGDRDAVPRLQRDLAARDADLAVLRAHLYALGQEARRQMRWAELLTAFGRHTPPALRLQLVEVGRVAPPTPPAGQAAGAVAARAEETLRLEAVTPLRAGSPPLLEIAQFMAALMRDPAVGRRFQLKSWEIKPPSAATAAGDAFLTVTIILVERPS